MMKKRLFQGMARWIPYSPISMLVPNMLFMSVKQKAMVLQEQEASRFMHQVPDMPQKYRWMRLGICFFYLLVLIYAVISSLQRRSLGSFLPIWLDPDPKITLKFSFMQFVEGITVFWKTKILRILFYALCAFCIQRITHYLSLDKLSVLLPSLHFSLWQRMKDSTFCSMELTGQSMSTICCLMQSVFCSESVWQNCLESCFLCLSQR